MCGNQLWGIAGEVNSLFSLHDVGSDDPGPPARSVRYFFSRLGPGKDEGSWVCPRAPLGSEEILWRGKGGAQEKSSGGADSIRNIHPSSV